MYRSSEEEREYQSLSRERKARYDFEASQDSTLSHGKIMKIIGFREAVIDVLPDEDGGGGEIDLGDNRVKKTLLEKTGDFLRNTAPSVWRSVKDSFMSAITYLGNLIERGMIWVTDNVVVPIIEILDDIFG